jgi:hypothetical protein
MRWKNSSALGLASPRSSWFARRRLGLGEADDLAPEHLQEPR